MAELILLIIALICFAAAAAEVHARLNLTALGLAFATAALLVGGIPL